MAAKYGYLECIKILIQKNVDVNQIDASGRSALHLAAWFDHSETAELLLEHGADISLSDYQGHSPLHLACWFGQAKTATVLIEHGAPLDITDQSLRTPLHYACQHNRPEIVRLLLKAGASTKIKNTNGKTAEQIAIQEERLDIIDILQDANKEKNEPTSGTGKAPEVEYIDEHNRMKTHITKLIETRDAQVEQINTMQTKLEKQESSLISLANSQKELVSRIGALQQLLLGISNSVRALPPRQAQPTAATPGPPLTQQRINVQRTPPASSTGISVPIMCSWCRRNPATMKCTHCRNPFCSECVEHATANGCPICHQF